MSLTQLDAQIDTLRTELDTVRAEVAQLAAAAVARTLSGPVPAAGGDGFPPPSAGYRAGAQYVPEQGTLAGAYGDYVMERATGEVGSLAERARTLQLRANEYSVEWHKKWAIPVACIIFVLIGAPLAVRFPRGGAGMVIMISTMIFGIYYISLIGGESLGDKGRIAPFVGPWLPNIGFFAISLWGLARIGRETATSRGGGFDDFVHTTKGFLLKPFRRRRARLEAAGAD
jgi:lipopolysaccharide export system permease protein